MSAPEFPTVRDVNTACYQAARGTGRGVYVQREGDDDPMQVARARTKGGKLQVLLMWNRRWVNCEFAELRLAW